MEEKIYRLYCEKKVIENKLNHVEMKIAQEKIKGNTKCEENKTNYNPMRFIIDIVKDISAGAALMYIAWHYYLSHDKIIFHLVSLIGILLGAMIVIVCICSPIVSLMASKSKSKKIKCWECCCLILLAIFCVFVMFGVLYYTLEKAEKDMNKSNSSSFVECRLEKNSTI